MWARKALVLLHQPEESVGAERLHQALHGAEPKLFGESPDR